MENVISIYYDFRGISTKVFSYVLHGNFRAILLCTIFLGLKSPVMAQTQLCGLFGDECELEKLMLQSDLFLDAVNKMGANANNLQILHSPCCTESFDAFTQHIIIQDYLSESDTNMAEAIELWYPYVQDSLRKAEKNFRAQGCVSTDTIQKKFLRGETDYIVYTTKVSKSEVYCVVFRNRGVYGEIEVHSFFQELLQESSGALLLLLRVNGQCAVVNVFSQIIVH